MNILDEIVAHKRDEVAMSPRQEARKSAKSTTAADRKSEGFTDEERAAMKERARELKAEARRGPRAGKADGEGDVLARIAGMPEPDRSMAERLHAIIKTSAPALSPKPWYGMPAYAKDGKVVCSFQSAQKFKSRYATFGFSDEAKAVFTVLNGASLLRKYQNRDVAEGRFDPLTMVASSEHPPQAGLPAIAVRERAFVPTELLLRFRIAGMSVLHLWGGTAGNWGRRSLDLDEIEIMIVACKTAEPLAAGDAGKPRA